MDFASMKRNRKESMNKLVQESEKQQNKSFEPDERFWTPTTDDEGKGYAVLRFLPAPPGEEKEYVTYYQHNFQGPGGHWYNEKSLTTFNKKDPVGEFNRKLWNNGTEEGKDQARKQKRQLKYISNILVLKDPAKPENEGGVFLYRYGPMIYEKIDKALKPEFEDEERFNPFDLWEGANFKLKIKSKTIQLGERRVNIPNYEDSSFDRISALDDDDEKLEHIWKQSHPLAPFVDSTEFKSYEELEQRLNYVMEDVVSEDSSKNVEQEETPTPKSEPKHEEEDVDPLPEKHSFASSEEETPEETENEETEAKKNYDKFRNLAK